MKKMFVWLDCSALQKAMIGLILVTVSVHSAANRLVISTAQWTEGYTSQSGDGLYEELLETVYADFDIEFVYTHYLRSKTLVKTGTADMWLGAYKDEESFALYPKQAMDKDFIFALKLKQAASLDFHHLPADTVAAWLVGYQYAKYFPEYALSGIEVSDLATGLKLIDSGKIAFFLGDDSEIQTDAWRAKLSLSDYEFERFADLPLYPGFQKSSDSPALIKIWDKVLAELKQSGKLQQLYRKHGLLADYPF